MKLSVIICCYNEKNSIEKIIEGTQAVNLGGEWTREILVVDNCSTDGTRDILRARPDDPEVRIFYHEQNLGKGSSIRTGITHMTGDYMIIQDADFEYDPAEHTLFCREIERSQPAALFGSRVLGGHAIYEYAHAYWGVRLLTSTTNILFGSDLTDVATATKLVSAEVLDQLNLVGTTFDLDFELPCKILLAGYQIGEIPITYAPRTYAEGKKITIADGLQALWVIVKNRFRVTPVLKSEL